MDTDEDTDEEQEDTPLVASDEQARRDARLRHEQTVWSDDPLSNVTLVLLLLLALGGGILTGFYGFDGLARFVSHVRCATPSSSARTAAVPAQAAAATVKPADSPVGHEWLGGAVGGSEGAGHDERWGTAQQQPRNGSLLVLGILSGSRNFEQRDWLRRSTVKVPLLAAPQHGSCVSSGRAWRLWAALYSQGEAQTLGAQRLPRGLERAASEVADSTTSDL